MLTNNASDSKVETSAVNLSQNDSNKSTTPASNPSTTDEKATKIKESSNSNTTVKPKPSSTKTTISKVETSKNTPEPNKSKPEPSKDIKQPSKDIKQPTTKQTVYKSSKLGFSLTFPASWQDKYRVVENGDSLSVYFKPNHNVKGTVGLFFTIIKKTPELNESRYDTIGNTRYFKVGETTYFIGGPTDVNFPENDPEIDTYLKMNRERSTVLSTLKKL